MPHDARHPSARARRRLRTACTGVLGAALVVTLAGPAGGVPLRERDDPAWQAPEVESVPVTDVDVADRGDDPAVEAAMTTAPDVTWPETGTARVGPVRPAADTRALAEAGPTARAGGLPVWVRAAEGTAERTGAAATAGPDAVDVELLGRQDDRLLLRLTRTDGIAAAGTVRLGVGYEEFRHAYGGDWASRLRIVRVPECARMLPDVRACTGTPVETHNDGSGQLWADVQAGTDDEPALYAVQAGPDGGAGAFSASTLSPAATWSVGDQSGDFRWNYPMESPPAPAGPSPEVALGYSSGTVDGRTSATNNQPSWAGEGFDIAVGGSIERRYRQCSTDDGGNNGDRKVGDLCWATDNATLSLEGSSGELIRDDDTGEWHARADDGSRIERRTGANNGARNGEYWVVTAKNGTRYYFGLNRLPGWNQGDPVTRSAWTVPVFGNHAGEPCHAAEFEDSWCQQAYRWNLDYVVDPRGNAMAFYYDTESNNYARNRTATSVSTYIRSGHLNRIEYGLRDGAAYDRPAAARVVFDSAPRCIPGSACTTDEPETYPDTPLDQACTSDSNCDKRFHPTFWTTKRLAKVTTQIRRTDGFADVQSWTLRHSFPDPGDGTRAGLWLEAVTNAGHVGGSEVTPEVNFDGIQLDNRVDGIDGIPPMKWWRISAVHYGTGGELAVEYSGEDCVVGDLPKPATNGRRCYPVRWTPEGQAERRDWFHKYVVTEVTESDRVSGVEPVVTRVEYLSPAAWRFDEEKGLVDVKRKTWSKWRGYEHVRVIKGHPDGTRSVNEQRFFRGMDGDRTASGGRKDVDITDSTGTSVPDSPALAGQTREEITYADGEMIDRSITDQWVSAPTASDRNSWGTSRAHLTEERALEQDEATDDGRRRSGSENFYADDGTLTMSTDRGDLADPDDDTCTRYEYTENPGAGILELPSRRQTVSVGCGAEWTPDDVVEDERLYYDGADSPQDPPTRGEVTKAERLSGFDTAGKPQYQTVLTARYDQLGRDVSVTDALGRTSSVQYTPSDGGPLTETVVTRADGSTSTTRLEPAWGEETTTIDEAGRRTDITYDPLGRTSAVWMPGQDRGSETPTMAYEYELRDDGPNVVTTETLQADGSIETVHELSDGLLRPRQTQRPAPGGGRVIEDTIYDSRGLVVKENGPYYNDAPPTTDVVLPNEAALPTQKVTTYDGAERPAVETIRSEGDVEQRTRHSYAADRHTVTPPDGEAPSTTFTDIRGKKTQLRQFTGSAPSGEFDRTDYTYTPSGQLASVTDPAGNTWRFEYDVRGRLVSEHDPDKGTTTYTYDDADQLVSKTDARGVTLAYAYDRLGRKTAVHEGSLSGPKRATWVYDTLAEGKLTSSTRWVDGEPYTTRVTGYDDGGRPEGTEVVIPESEGALAGTYPVSHTYTESGEVASTRLPEAGDLAAETLEFGYNGQDLPTTLSSDLGSYVSQTRYTPFGEVSSMVMEHDGGFWVQNTYEYDTATRRLTRVVTEKELRPRRVSNVSYRYDPSGNVVEITDEPSSLSDEPTDTQCFDYDHLRRLTEAWTPGSGDCGVAPGADDLGGPAPYWHSWTFDAVGNRLTETRHGQDGSSTSTYRYPGAGEEQPHALQDVTTPLPGGGESVDRYRYDATGNLVERQVDGSTDTFRWDAEGNLAEVGNGEQTTSFVYDADGNRLIRRDATGTTLYLQQTEITLKPGGSLAGTRFYQHGQKTVASRTADGLTWLGSDHHGTTTVAVDDEDQQVHRRRMDPYGNVRGAAPTAWPNQRGFVGGTRDPGTGLTHLGAREYDPTTGRFISVDPVADYSDPQQINGYAYANNSPVTYTDPTGEAFWIPVAVIAVRAVPVVVRVARTVSSTVRYKAPVVRKVPRTVVTKVKGFFGWLFSQIKTIVRTIWHTVVSWVTRVKTVFKRVIKTIRKIKHVRVRIIKRVPVKRVTRKPASRTKHKAKQRTRNTRSPKKSTPQRRDRPRTRPPSRTSPKSNSAQQRPPSQSGKSSRSSNRRPDDDTDALLDDMLRRAGIDRPDPSTWDAHTVDRRIGSDPLDHVPEFDKDQPAPPESGRNGFGRGSRFGSLITGFVYGLKLFEKGF